MIKSYGQIDLVIIKDINNKHYDKLKRQYYNSLYTGFEKAYKPVYRKYSLKLYNNLDNYFKNMITIIIKKKIQINLLLDVLLKI